jgi:hypothetical protein
MAFLPIFIMAPRIPSGPSDLFLSIIANCLLIMLILMVKGLSEWIEFTSGMSRSQLKTEA